MIIKTDIYLSEFDAWSGARDTLDRIINEGKCDELESMLEELYPEGMTDTELNDLLWFDDEWLFEMLDIDDEEEEDEDDEDEDEDEEE